MRRSWILLVVLLFGLGCSCDGVKKLFAKKTVKADPATATGDPPKPPPPPPPIKPALVPVKVSWTEPLARVPVGAWARWRIAFEDGGTFHRELVLLARVGDRVWLEETTDPDGRDEVAWRLIDGKGAVLFGFRGAPKTQGDRVRVDGVADPYLLDGATDTGQTETIEVGGQALTCKKLTLADDESAAWVCDAVPFGGLVRLRQEGVEYDLIEHGTGRTSGKLTNPFPVVPPTGAGK